MYDMFKTKNKVSLNYKTLFETLFQQQGNFSSNGHYVTGRLMIRTVFIKAAIRAAPAL